MSTIITPLRARYRAKLDRPAPESKSCANSSQVRRLIAKAMMPSPEVRDGWLHVHRYSLLATAILLVAIAGACTFSLSFRPPAVVAVKPKLVSTFILGQPELRTRFEDFIGTVQSSKRSELGFVQSGRVQRLFVKEGDRVQAGTLLAELDSSSIASELAVARTELKLAETRFKAIAPSNSIVRRSRVSSIDAGDNGRASSSTQTLVEHWHSVVKQLELQLLRCQLRAPYPAIVAQIHLSEGSVISADRSILRVVANEEPKVKVAVPIAQVDRMNANARYEFYINEQKLEGSLIAVLPEINTTEQTRDVLFDLPGASSIDIGTPAHLRIKAPTGDLGFRVPKTAVQVTKAGTSSIAVIRSQAPEPGSVKGRKSIAYKQAVKVLQAEEGWILVRGDLKAGDRVMAVLPEQQANQQEVRYSDAVQWRLENWFAYLPKATD